MESFLNPLCQKSIIRISRGQLPQLIYPRFCICPDVAVCSTMPNVIIGIDPLPNPLLLFTAQIVAIMSVFLLAAGYLKSDPKSSSARVFAVIALFVVFYLLNGMSGDSIDANFRINLSAIDRLIELGTSSVSGLFMIYCFLIFQEQQKFPTLLGLAFGLQVVLELLFPFLRAAQNQIDLFGYQGKTNAFPLFRRKLAGVTSGDDWKPCIRKKLLPCS